MSEKLKVLTPLVDTDLIVYRIGFAANNPDEPIENCLHSVKLTVEKILDRFPERKDQVLYLTGKDNFRDKVATIKKYKGNREGKPKPQFYEEIREYLINRWGATVIDGMEADDAQGIKQWATKGKETCIVTIDKDLNMIPGYHYNWVKDEFSYITLADANKFFWWQMLVGDPTDNIPGIDGIGVKKADKLLASSKDHRKSVEEAYKKQYGNEWMVAFDEVAKLLWILREEGKTYSDYV